MENIGNLEKTIICSLFDSKVRLNSISYLEKYMFKDELYSSLFLYFKGLESEKVDDYNTLKLKISTHYNIENEDNEYRLKSIYNEFNDYITSDLKETLNQIENFIVNKKLYNSINKNLSENKGKLVISDSIKSQIMESVDFKISVEKTTYDFTNEEDLHLIGMNDSEEVSVIKSKFPIINECSNNDGYCKGDLVCFAARSGIGKTTILVDEASNFIKQGFKVLYVNLGDMKAKSMMIRFLSNLTGEKSYEVKKNWFSYYMKCKDQLANLRSIVLEAGEYDIRTVIAKANKVYNSGFEFDVVIFDYDQNFKVSDGFSMDMYNAFGSIYQKLKAFAGTKYLVMTASQIKIGEYEEEIVGMNALADSSKKANQLDYLIGIGRNNKNPTIGSLHLGKVRDGRSSVTAPIKFNNEYSSIDQISKEQYEYAKKEVLSDEINTLFGEK